MFKISVAHFHARRLSALMTAVLSALLVIGVVPNAALAVNFAAKASVSGGPQYLNDTAGTTFSFTVKNTGWPTKIGAVRISRPFALWTVTACPSAPAGWTRSVAASRCDYKSPSGPSGDLAPSQSASFLLTAKTGAGAADVTGSWKVIVSKSNSFANASDLIQAGAMGSGLSARAWSFQILAARVRSAPATPGAACPTTSTSAPATSTNNYIVICGRNRSTGTQATNASYSSLGGTFIASHGTYSSGPIAPTSTSRVLGNWQGVTITSSSGSGKTIVAQVGRLSQRSPRTTLNGFTALNSPPKVITSAGTTSYSENDHPTVIDPNVTVADDNSSLVAAKVRITTGFAAAQDTLLFTDTLNISGSYNTSTGVLTLSGPDTLAAYQAALQSVEYSNSSENPTTSRTIAFSASDAQGYGTEATKAIAITPVNDAPVIDSTAPDTASEDTLYTYNATSSDPDGPGATWSVTASDTCGGAIGSTTGVYTFTPAGPNPPASCVVAIQVSDGAIVSTEQMTTVTIGAVDDGPTNLAPLTLTTNEDTSASVAGLSVSDADSTTLTVSLLVSHGTLTLGTTAGLTFLLGDGSLDTGMRFSGTQVDLNAALASVSYFPNSDYNGDDTLSLDVTDGTTTAPTKNVAITITAVADVVDDLVTTGEDDDITFNPISGTNGASADNFEATPSITSVTQGTNGSVSNLGNDVTYTADADFNGSDSFTYTVTSGGVTETGTVSVTVGAANDAPTSSAPASKTTNEDTSATVTGLSVADVDSASLIVNLAVSQGTLSMSTLTGLTFTAGDGTSDSSMNFSGSQAALNAALASLSYAPNADYNGADTLSLDVTDGVDPAATKNVSITVTAVADVVDDSITTAEDDDITFDPIAGTEGASADNFEAIPSITSVTQGTNGSVSNLGNDVTYAPDADFNGSDSFTYTVTSGGVTETGTVSVTVGAANDGPVVTTTAGAAGYIEGGASVVIDPGLTVSDVDSTNLSGALVSITTSFSASDGDSLNFTDQGTITGLYTAATGVLVLSGTATPAAYQAALRSVTFSNTDVSPGLNTATRTVSFQVTDDGAATSNVATRAVTVSPANSTPVANDQSPSINEEAPLIITLTASDADDDALTLTAVDPSNGSLDTLSPTVDCSAVNTCTAQVTYTPDANFNGSDSFTFTVSDGTATSANATVSITVNALNDAPQATNLNAAETYTEDTARNLTDIVVSDVDSANVIATLTLSNATAGSLTTATAGTTTSTFSAGVWSAGGPIAEVNTLLAGVTFNPASNFNANFTIATSVTDAVALPVTGSKAMTGTAVNDAPQATSLNAAETYTEDTALNLTDIVVSDVDSANVTATLTLSTIAAGSLTTATSNAVTSTFVSGVWSASGALADVNVLLAGVTFTPAPNFNSNFSIATSVSDGVAPAVTGSKAMTGTAVNDAPQATNLNAAETYTEDTALNLLDIVISDVDSATVTATLTLSNTAAGSLTTATSNSVTSTFVSGVWSASGALADVNVLLAGVTVNPAANFNSNFSIATSVTDGVATALTGSKAMTGTSVNDAPVLDATKTPVLTAQNEDDPSPVGAVGTAVSSLVDLNPPVGGLDNVTDPDSGAATGIAITATAGAGTWWYSLNNGTNWTAFVAPSATTARLIAAVNGRIYYQPAANVNGTLSPAITFRTWDISSGTNGATADASTNGNATPFSTATDTADLTVNAVNDAPVGGVDSGETVANVQLFFDSTPGAGVPGTTKAVTAGAEGDGLLANDSDPVEGDNISITGVVGCIDVSAPFVCATVGGGEINVASNGSFTYTPDDGDTAADSFQYVLTDDGTPSPASSNVTVNLTFVGNRIWFVKNNQPDGGLGRSSDPFNTLVEAQTAANAANDRVLVYFGDGSTTNQNSGFTFGASGMTLQGEAIALTTGVTVNGVSNATLVAAGLRPLIGNAAGNGVTATNRTGITVQGLSIAGSANAVEINSSAATSGTTTITNSVVRGAGAEGIEVNVDAGTTGTLTLAITSNSWDAAGSHIGSAIDIVRSAGNLNVDLTGNTGIVSNASGIVVNSAVTGITTITGFAGNSISGNTVSSGVNINNATFDATPGATIQQVDADTLAVGSSGNPVGGAGLLISGAQGNLFFDDLDVFSATGTALGAAGTGSGLTLAVTPASPDGGGTSTLDADSGAALDISTATVDLRLADLDSNTGGTGFNLATVAGQLRAPAGSSITKASGAGTVFSVASSSATVTYAGTLSVTSSGTGVSLTGNSGTTSFSGVLTLSTGASPAFTATGGGTVTATASGSTLTTTTGAALNVSSTTVGGGGLTFQAITGASINLASTGSGPITVTGATSIPSRAGTGISLNTVGGTVSLGATTIANPTGAGGHGIRIENSSGAVTIASANISNANQTVAQVDANNDGFPDNDADGDAVFLKNNTGSFTLNGGTLLNSEGDGIDIRTAQDLHLNSVTINGVGTFVGTTGNAGGIGGHAIFAWNLSGTNTITNSVITNWEATATNGLRWWVSGSRTGTMTITGTDFKDSGDGVTNPTPSGAILYRGDGSSVTTLTVGGTNPGDPNDFTNIYGEAIGHGAGDGGTSTATANVNIINNNFIGTPNGGQNSVSARHTAAAKAAVVITGNTFDGVGNTHADTSGVIDIGGDALLAGNSISFNISNNIIKNVGLASACQVGSSLPCDGKRGIDVFIDDGSVINGPILVHHNTITNVRRMGIIFDTGGSFSGSNFTARITENCVGKGRVNQTDTGCTGADSPVGLSTALSTGGESGIRIENRNNTGRQLNILVLNNVVRNGNSGVSGSALNGSGIFIRSQQTATLHATVSNNSVQTLNSLTSNAIRVDANFSASGTATVCVDISGNTLAAPADEISLGEVQGVVNVEQASLAALSAANGGAVASTLSGSPQFGVTCSEPPG